MTDSTILELGIAERIRDELVEHAEHLVHAFAEFDITCKGIVALGGTPPAIPELEFLRKENSGGGQNEHGADTSGLEAALADAEKRAASLQASLHDEKNTSARLLNQVEEARAQLAGKWESEFSKPVDGGKELGTAVARSNKGIGSNAPYFLHPPQELADGFAVGYEWTVYELEDGVVVLRPKVEVDAPVPPPEGDAKPPAASPIPAAELTPERKSPVTVTLEQVRDVVCTYDIGVAFSTSEIAERMNVSPSTARKHIATLAEQGKVRRPEGGQTNGSSARWERPPIPNNAPTTRPRGDHLLGVPPQRRASAPVPGTGVPAGPAETPGKLRRQQKKAARVQHKPVKGVRI
jgi:DNA-binding transcriptional ArsR family regulator